jgi:tetratricopeptide (TPR) repeat protein
VFVAAFLVVPRDTAAADTVIVRTTDGQNQRRVTGTVVDYTGELLRLQHPSGREEKFPSSRIVDVAGDWTKNHQEANRLFAEGDYEQAEPRYRVALRDEDRRWVRRRVLAQLTWCYRHLGQTDKAVKAFLPLYRDDAKTLYFDAIPLTWTSRQPEVGLANVAGTWMKDDGSAARLIGASWSLSSSRRAEAIQVLRRFAADPDPRIVFLAEAQLWRTKVTTVNQQDINRWRQRIEVMPARIRGGPYYVLGQALARHAQHEQAALAFMKAAILHKHQRDLAPHALLAAGRELETIEQGNEAAGLYREILVDYASSQAASEAGTRLEAQRSRGKP